MDYQGGRKDAGSAPTAGFGQSPAAGFGQPAAPNTFGQPAATTSTFGAPPPAGGLFGSTAGTGGFGSNAGGFGSTSTSAKPGGLFGAPQQNTSNPFGGQTSSATGGLFGQPAQAQPATGGGLFGNTNPFGLNPAQPQQQATSTFGGFGANKPAFASSTTNTFGQPNSGTSTTFGQPTGAGSNVFGFGQNQQTQQPQPAAGGLFGGGGFGEIGFEMSFLC